MLNLNNISDFSIKKDEKSIETLNDMSLEDKNIEQNSIITPDEYSFEAEGDDSSFEEAADESSNNDDQNGDGSENAPDFEGTDDFGDGSDDLDGNSEEGDDFSEGEDDSNGDGDDSNGLNDLDIRGSSLNPYTQINQKMFYVNKLNELYDSILNTIDKYNAQYADRYEIGQLRELSKIVDDERNAFMMQQNPENFIKLRLYYKRYEEIVQKFVDENISKNSD